MQGIQLPVIPGTPSVISSPAVISKRSEKSPDDLDGVVPFGGRSLQEISPCGRDDKEIGRDDKEIGRDDKEVGRDDGEVGRDDKEVGRDDKEAGRDEGEVKPGKTGSARNLIVPDRAKPEMTPPLSFRALSVISKRSEKSPDDWSGVVPFGGCLLHEISPCGRDDKEAGRDDGEVKAGKTGSARNLIVPDRAKPEMTPPLSFRALSVISKRSEKSRFLS